MHGSSTPPLVLNGYTTFGYSTHKFITRDRKTCTVGCIPLFLLSRFPHLDVVDVATRDVPSTAATLAGRPGVKRHPCVRTGVCTQRKLADLHPLRVHICRSNGCGIFQTDVYLTIYRHRKQESNGTERKEKKRGFVSFEGVYPSRFSSCSI